MRRYSISTILGLPLVTVVLTGPKRSKRVQLIFDSGAFMTQIHRETLTSLGIAFTDREPDMFVKGVTGPKEPLYLTPISRLFAVGERFTDVPVGAINFTDWVKDGVDGLLGWDLIQQLHFEMDGPNGLLKVF